MSTDQRIADILTRIAIEVAVEEAMPRGSAVQATLSSDLEDIALESARDFVLSRGFETVMLHITKAILAKYLWRVAICVDECRVVEGATLRIGVKLENATAVTVSNGDLHGCVVHAFAEQGIEL